MERFVERVSQVQRFAGGSGKTVEYRRLSSAAREAEQGRHSPIFHNEFRPPMALFPCMLRSARQHQIRMNHIFLGVLALHISGLTVWAQNPPLTDTTPVTTAVPLLQIKLGFDPGASPAKRHLVVRPDVPEQSPLFRSLGWRILYKDRQLAGLAATSYTSQVVTTDRSGNYKVFLISYLNGRYERISNVIDFNVDLEKKGKPDVPPGAVIVKPGSLTSDKPASLAAKDLLKLDLKKDGKDFLITRPSLPLGADWKNLSWVVTLDGRNEMEIAARDDPTFKPYITKKGSYEVRLRARPAGRETDVSESVKFRVVR